MTRHAPSDFAKKLGELRAEVERARTESRRAFAIGPEVLPGVRLLTTQSRGTPVVFSLWSWDRDIAEICGDAAYPATAGLLAIDGDQLMFLKSQGVVLDRSFLTRSESQVGLWYVLLDHVSPERLELVVSRLLPGQSAAGE